ncbi:hypothetical protein R8Z50_16205 [Longispora sp. K20-0274]|uniref:hypothetical protein n=1 Tax=Longispora sp. K20-0274 TaxID=3088255 RepID=UPI00399A8250
MSRKTHHIPKMPTSEPVGGTGSLGELPDPALADSRTVQELERSLRLAAVFSDQRVDKELLASFAQREFAGRDGLLPGAAPTAPDTTAAPPRREPVAERPSNMGLGANRLNPPKATMSAAHGEFKRKQPQTGHGRITP